MVRGLETSFDGLPAKTQESAPLCADFSYSPDIAQTKSEHQVIAEAKAWAEEITPATEPCLGDNCKYRQPGQDTCQLTTHHTIYPRRKVLFTERRNLINTRRSPVSKIQVHLCRHVEIHHKDPPGELDPVFPKDEVVDAYARDIGVIEDLALASLVFRDKETELSDNGVNVSDEAVKNYIQDRITFQQRRRELVEKIKKLQIVTPAVIAGALLELAPEEGLRLVSDNSDHSVLDFSERTLLSLNSRRKKHH